MKIKTSELTGSVLDWAVAKCANIEHYFDYGVVCLKGQPFDNNEHYWLPTQNWSQGGPIIEREGMSLHLNNARSYVRNGDWVATGLTTEIGPTPLVAAMRCFVASKLGDEVEIPEQVYTQMFDNA